MKLFILLFATVIATSCYAQLPKDKSNDWKIKPRGYFRYAMPLSDKFELGSRMNLSGMGSLGGRHQEGDWVELGASFNLSNIAGQEKDKPQVKLHTLFSIFPTKGTYMHSGTSYGIQEFYVTVDDTLGNLPIQFWTGLRYYRTNNIEASDYFNFNNLSGPTAGVKIKNSQFAIITDAPFQNNPGGQYGTSPDPFKTSLILVGQHQQVFGKKHIIDFLGEYHIAGWEFVTDSTGEIFSSGNDWGWVLGLRHHWQISKNIVNRASFRYGSRIANGPDDDNWSSRTFITVGNANVNEKFDGAHAYHITNNLQYSGSKLFNFEAYSVYRYGKGADNAIDFNNRANEKHDFTTGARITWFLADKFHFITEGSYQVKEYDRYTGSGRVLSTSGQASVNHFSIGPMYVPSGKRNMFTRPTFRLIYSIAFYNKYAKQEQLSDYLVNVGGDIGHYIGLKTEFWF